MEDPQRPLALPGFDERLRGWIAWFGVGRIVGSAVAMVIVCAGAYWLVRTPPPPTEASLPVATSVPTSTEMVGLPTVSTGALALPTDEPATVVVHVAGAVLTPGVYRLDVGSRADDAIAAAGGALAAADPNALNLALVIADGSRLYVPMVGEEVPEALVPTGGGSSADGSPRAPTLVDVNRATANELDALPGVGPATALAIVNERNRGGPFVTVDELDRVPGIGAAKLEALRGLVAV